jgi:hypothetical protein
VKRLDIITRLVSRVRLQEIWQEIERLDRRWDALSF